MSLYGALFASVSGLIAQGSKIGVISDNIANVNTIGYKQSQTQFQTLVTNSSAQSSYSPGGVITSTRQLVDQQGLIQATNASTDIAISGTGLFVVNSQSASGGTPLYTRAGSFRQDNLGNFVNASGFFLQGWPLDREGRLPGEPGNLNAQSFTNLSSLQTVNVESASGTASATTTVAIGANLNAGESTFPGAGATIAFDSLHPENRNIRADDIMVPGGVNNIARGDQFTVTTGAGETHTYTYGGFITGRDVTSNAASGDGGIVPVAGGPAGNILDATSSSQAFLGTTGVSGFTNAALAFTINTPTSGTVTFTYVTSSPNAAAGQFNNLTNLATALNEVNGITARIVNNQLFVGPENATETMTINNGDDVGAGPLAGIDWVSELGLANGAPASLAGAADRFSSLSSLAELVNQTEGLKATIANPLADATLTLRVNDPLDTINFFDGSDNNIAASTNTGSLLNEFGFASLAQYTAGAGTENEVTNLGPAYDASGSAGKNMSSGDLTAQFSRNVQVFDSLGSSHQLQMSYLKIGANEWAVEVHSIPPADVNSSLVDGQVAVGTLSFNGDGTLRAVSSGLLGAKTIRWTNASSDSQITFDFGTAGQPFGTIGATVFGQTDGLSQFDADYNVSFVNQNGSPVGQLIGVAIDKDGFVTASYSNGETRKVFKLPLADFSNPNGLTGLTGNVYAQSAASGEVNLREAGKNGVGSIAPSALEASNVELAEQLTDMIVAQRAYQANTRVITTANDLLDALNRI